MVTGNDVRTQCALSAKQSAPDHDDDDELEMHAVPILKYRDTANIGIINRRLVVVVVVVVAETNATKRRSLT